MICDRICERGLICAIINILKYGFEIFNMHAILPKSACSYTMDVHSSMAS